MFCLHILLTFWITNLLHCFFIYCFTSCFKLFPVMFIVIFFKLTKSVISLSLKIIKWIKNLGIAKKDWRISFVFLLLQVCYSHVQAGNEIVFAKNARYFESKHFPLKSLVLGLQLTEIKSLISTLNVLFKYNFDLYF